MTAKEKAFELILKIEKELIDNRVYRGTIKKLALIAVDEILEMDIPILQEEADKFYDYWGEVKHEINNFK